MLLRLLLRRVGIAGRVAAASTVVCVALFAVGTAAASAATSCSSPSAGATGDVCSFSLTPSSLTAGSDPSLTSTINFNYGSSTTDSVKSLTVTLPPGLLSALGAIPEQCTAAQLATPIPSCPAGSQIGTGSLVATFDGATLPSDVALYLMPAPAAGDVAGLGAVVSFDGIPLAVTSGFVAVAQANGSPVLQLTFPDMPDSVGPGPLAIDIQVNSLSFTINGTAPSATGGATTNPFTRMPTNCSTATATLSVQTYAASSADGTGSSSFTPVNCSSLPFSPGFTATALKDTGDEGVKLVTVVTVSAAGAADQTLSLSVPAATLAAYEFNAAKEFGDVVGQAIAQTALLPTPLVGTVSLTGSIAAPTLTITFPAPFALSLVGNINLLANSVTFGNVPDVPLSTLTVTLNGGSQALYYTTCAQPTGAVTAGFTGQNGATATVSSPFTVSGCTSPVAFTASGSASGLNRGAAKLAFGLNSAQGTKLTSLTVSLPKGLSFNKKGLAKGVSVSGAKIASAKLSGGKLAVTLRSGVASLKLKVSGQALTESAALRKQVKAKKVKTVTATVVAKNSAGKSATIKVKLSV